jgi:hypothetical protein
MLDPEEGRFWVSWQDADLHGRHLLVEDSEVKGASAAVEWGRQRALRVFIRLGREHATYFTAGEEAGFAQDDEDAFPSWPPRAAPSGGWWLPLSG